MSFKPMLAAKCEDIKALEFPVMASPKLDGIRALVHNGQLVSRQLKPIPNFYVQALFSGLPEGTDGELILGAPTTDPYRRTVSAVMTEDEQPDVTFYVFDNFLFQGGFAKRFVKLQATKEYAACANVIILPHTFIDDADQLAAYEAKQVDAGYEGVMVRSTDGPYKQNRSTAREGYLLKVKRFEDSEAAILACYERMHNANEATVDKLGHTARSSHKDNLVGHGDLGGFDVRDIHTGVEFSIGTGFDAATRVKLWKIRESLVGQVIKYKYFPTGSKERPRFPVWLGFRNPIDL